MISKRYEAAAELRAGRLAQTFGVSPNIASASFLFQVHLANCSKSAVTREGPFSHGEIRQATNAWELRSRSTAKPIQSFNNSCEACCSLSRAKPRPTVGALSSTSSAWKSALCASRRTLVRQHRRWSCAFRRARLVDVQSVNFQVCPCTSRLTRYYSRRSGNRTKRACSMAVARTTGSAYTKSWSRFLIPQRARSTLLEISQCG